jgi:uncharacterized protein (DUF2147 family)
MRKLILIAALLTSSSAYAGDTVSFELGGHEIRFDTVDECTFDNLDSCLSLSITEIKPPSANPAPAATPLQIKPLPPKVAATKPVEAKPKLAVVAPAPAAHAATAAPGPAVASHAGGSRAAAVVPAPAPVAPVAAKPAEPARLATVPATPAIPQPAVAQPEAKPAVAPTPPAPAAPAQMASLAPKQQMLTPPAAAASPSPLGVWQTEEKEGKIRIEACGVNLCGYAINAATNQNGTQILINMKPGSGKWAGRIHDPNTGSDYDSTIALKGTDALKVQGCALGGWVCGGQTWTRLN